MNIVNQLDLVNGLNINPIPLEMSQSMTTSKWLMAMQAKINEIILVRNEVLTEANAYSDTKYNQLLKELQTLQNLVNTADIIPDGSIGAEKFTSEFLIELNALIQNAPKALVFGIDDNGYFYAGIPTKWNEIEFSTNELGQLILEY